MAGFLGVFGLGATGAVALETSGAGFATGLFTAGFGVLDFTGAGLAGAPAAALGAALALGAAGLGFAAGLGGVAARGLATGAGTVGGLTAAEAGTAATGLVLVTVAFLTAATFATALAAGAAGTTSVADDPVIRPAATWVRRRASVTTGIMGVSTAGFSARAPLAARALARLGLRTVSPTGAESGVDIPAAAGSEAAGWRGGVASFLACATAWGRVSRAESPESASSAGGLSAPGNVSATAEATPLPSDESAFAAAGSAFRPFLRLFRDREDRLAGAFSVGRPPSTVSGVTSAPGRSAAPKSAASGSVASAPADGRSVRRSAFLRAVRLAPPRERRFFFLPGSDSSVFAAPAFTSGGAASGTGIACRSIFLVAVAVAATGDPRSARLAGASSGSPVKEAVA